MTAEKLDLKITRRLEHGPAEVFRALTEPAIYARWMGPEGAKTTVQEMDVVEGGRLALTVDVPGGPTVDISGVYREVAGPDRLVHSWLVGGDENETLVSFELHPDGAGTRLELTHTGFADSEDRGQNEGGWKHQLDRLVAALDE
jgi:uncharacterized protein YndB with AHSA1/START domain